MPAFLRPLLMSRSNDQRIVADSPQQFDCDARCSSQCERCGVFSIVMHLRHTRSMRRLVALVLGVVVVTAVGIRAAHLRSDTSKHVASPRPSPMPVPQLAHTSSITHLESTRDGRFAVSASAGLIVVWDVRSRRQAGSLSLGNHEVLGVSTSPDSRSLLVATETGLAVYDLFTLTRASGLEVKLGLGVSGDRSLAVFVDGGDVLFSADGEIFRWKPGTPQASSSGPQSIASWFIPSTGPAPIRLDPEKIDVLDPQTLQVLATTGAAGLRTAALSKSGRWLAVLPFDRPLELVEVRGERRCHVALSKFAENVTWSEAEHAFLVLESDQLTRVPPCGEGEPSVLAKGWTGNLGAVAGSQLLVARASKLCFFDGSLGYDCHGGQTEPSSELAFPTATTLISMGWGEAQLWDLEQARMVRRFIGFPGPVSKDGRHIALLSTLTEPTINVFDVSVSAPLVSVQSPRTPVVGAAFSSDGTELLFAAVEGLTKTELYRANLANGIPHLVRTFEGAAIALAGNGRGTMVLQIRAEGGVCSLFVLDEETLEIKTRSLCGTLLVGTQARLKLRFSPNGEHFIAYTFGETAGDGTSVFDLNGTRVLSEPGALVGWFDDSTVSLAGERLATIELGTKTRRPLAMTGSVAAVTRRDKLMAAANTNGSVALADARTGEPLVSLLAQSLSSGTEVNLQQADPVANAEFAQRRLRASVAIAPDGSYLANGNPSGLLAVRLNGRVIPFQDVDTAFNRPNVVLRRIGLASETELAALDRLVDARLSSNTNADAMVDLDDTPTKTAEPQLEVHGTVRGVAGPVVLHLDVNGAPQPPLEVKEGRVTFNVPLRPGRNVVRVAVGGFPTRFEVLQTPREPTKPSLELVSIGVSEYADKNYRLDYAAKDASDFAQRFSGEAYLYERQHVRVLTDAEATREAVISALNAAAAAAGPQDQLVVMLSGHGLLTKEMRYIFAPSNMDFTNPENAGISFEEIASLLGKSAAQSKMVFLDSCHSGPLDTNDRYDVPTSTGTGTVQVRGSKGLGVASAPSPLVLGELFSDEHSRSGLITIAAASASQFAFESGEWNNGVFTLSILEGLSTSNTLYANADGNNDGSVTASELQTWVAERVSELTRGKQRPAFRSTNLEYDPLVFPLTQL